MDAYQELLELELQLDEAIHRGHPTSPQCRWCRSWKSMRGKAQVCTDCDSPESYRTPL